MKTEPNDPIQPVTLRQVGENDFRIASEKDIQQGLYLSQKMGMSKREEFSARAMQGLLSIFNDENRIVPNLENVNYMASLSVIAADALINELNKTQEGK